MIHALIFFTFSTANVVHTVLSIIGVHSIDLVAITLWATGFLCLLNIGLALFFRKNTLREVLSYYAICMIEMAIFLFALFFHVGIIAHVPYHLPPGLPFDRAEIGATLAVGIGLFPAAYWHHTTFSDLSTRMAEDAKVIRERDGGVHVRENGPGAWMN